MNTLPTFAWQFWWTDTIISGGLCMEEGMIKGWLKRDKEFDKIVKTILTTPKYLNAYLSATFDNFRKQLFNIENAELNPQKDLVDFLIKNKYPGDVEQFRNSLQYKNIFRPSQLDSFAVPFTNTCTVIVFLTLIIFSIFYRSMEKRKRVNSTLYKFTLLIVLSFLANAWICVFFSGNVNRFQGRIAWLMPMLVFIWITSWYKNRKKSTAQEIENCVAA